jgi:alpha-beta hydrolase superfamily lysophospholipase
MYPGLKIFMGGLSLGGAIAFKIGVKNPKLTDGAILLSPAIK